MLDYGPECGRTVKISLPVVCWVMLGMVLGALLAYLVMLVALFIFARGTLV